MRFTEYSILLLSQPAPRSAPLAGLSEDAARQAKLEDLIRNEEMDILGVQALLADKKATVSNIPWSS